MRCLVKAGEHVAKGAAYAEVEVMKMMMPLLSPAAGKISFVASEGAPLLAGELIATLDLVRRRAGLRLTCRRACLAAGQA